MNAFLQGVSCELPESQRTNDDLVALNPTWDAASIHRKTGIHTRRVTKSTETASDLAFGAGQRLFEELNFDRSKVDALVFCTQSPDYYTPSSACLLQDRLNLPTSCGAFDINLGCSGFTYGLWLARALILSESATNVLLLAGETLSKYCNLHDLVTVTIFGDGAGAALISNDEANAIALVGPSIVGSDGRGAQHLIVPAGGARTPKSPNTGVERQDPSGNLRTDEQLFMNGAEVFGFTLTSVQAGIGQLLEKVGIGWDDIDLFLLHQANRFIIESLRKKMRVSPERMPIEIEDIGNTACASLPILLRRCADKGLLHKGSRCVLAGYGIGYSWAMTYITWRG